MFFKQVRRNAARNRKGNGLLFGSLVIAIIAFYTLLSLGEQDVMRFLKTIESDAVQKLLTMIPGVYVVSLFFVFFLVFFAYKYMMDSHRREFGMYLMLGMKRSRLFFMLLCETLWNSLISLAIGLPAALLLTEGVSLVTTRLVGLDIMEHTLSLSASAIGWTVCGFVVVQFLSMLILCVPYGKAEPANLLRSDAEKKQKRVSMSASSVFLVLGIVLLLAAYYLAIFQINLQSIGSLVQKFLVLLACGGIGTFFLYRGMGGFLGRRTAKKSGTATGLATFTGRQVQQSVLSQHRSLAIASLLMLVALACISYGIATGVSRVGDERTSDFSITCTQEQYDALLADERISDSVSSAYPVLLSRANTEFDIHEILDALDRLAGNSDAGSGLYLERVISESTYNTMMQALGKAPIALAEHEAALYSNIESQELYAMYRQMLSDGLQVGIGGVMYDLQPELHTEVLVADRGLTLMAALIVSDADFARLSSDDEPHCYNLHLSQALVDELGLMGAIEQVSAILDELGLEYNSYLGGIGRNLFYTVSASYLTIYLGVLFLLIANTVIGLKYLIAQRENKHRYITLLMLGADMESLCRSARKQIQTYFLLVLGVAVCSSVVAITMLFTNFTRLPSGESLVRTMLFAGIALVLFVLMDVVYITIVKRTACREIRALEITERG